MNQELPAITTVLKAGIITILLANCGISAGQTTTLPELVEAKDQWVKYATDGRRFQFEGRFEGRSANTIRIIKFDINCILPTSGTFPDNIRSGQRIDVIGRFLSENNKLSFVVSRILIRETDIDRLRSRTKDVPADQPEKLLNLAAEYQPDADFYDDVALKAEIAAIRATGILQLRKSARGDQAKLRELLRQSLALNVKPQVIQVLQFEVIYTAFKEPRSDVEALLAEIRKECTGWDQRIPPVPDRLKTAYVKNAVETFLEAQDNDRKSLHRLLYQSVRLRELQQSLRPDGSNGLEIAGLVRSEFGDDNALASEFEERDVQYRLAQIKILSRTDLKGLTELLTRLKRELQIPGAVKDWVIAQEQKFGTSNLAGLLRTSDEYLFAADLIKSSDYEKQGIEYLKQAWVIASESSPSDADLIADRLKRLGWERLDDRWLTNLQMQALPKNDVQLAIREGRVVPGMNPQQVVQTLGQPTKISRIASRKTVYELWSYEGENSAGMVVRFRRSPTDKAASALVDDVSRIQFNRP